MLESIRELHMVQENVKILMEEVERLTQGPRHKPGHKENENYEPVTSTTFKIS